jgi:phage terminase large subunit-like protein
VVAVFINFYRLISHRPDFGILEKYFWYESEENGGTGIEGEGEGKFRRVEGMVSGVVSSPAKGAEKIIAPEILIPKRAEYGLEDALLELDILPEEMVEMSDSEKEEITKAINDLVSLHSENPWRYYQSNPGAQADFHKGTGRERWYQGPNKVGKSVPIALEIIYFAMGEHPYRSDIIAPNQGWICGATLKTMAHDILHELRKWMPKKAYIRDNPYMVARFPIIRNGKKVGESEWMIMSYDSDIEVFQGPKVRGIAFNEQPPYRIYTESQSRGDAAIPLDIFGCLCPLQGNDWFQQEVIKPGKADPGGRIQVFQSHSIRENLALTEEVIQAEEKRWKGHPEENARLYGIPSPKSGRVYSLLREEIHRLKGIYTPALDELILIGLDIHPRLPMMGGVCAIDKFNVWRACDEYQGMSADEGKETTEQFANDFADILEKYSKNRIGLFLLDNNARWNERTSGTNQFDVITDVMWERLRLGIMTVGGKDFNTSWHRLTDKMMVKDGLTNFYVAANCIHTWEMFFEHCWADKVNEKETGQSYKPKKTNDHYCNIYEYFMKYDPAYDWRIPDRYTKAKPYIANNPKTGY